MEIVFAGRISLLPFFAAVLPVMILFCGLTIDVGMLQLKSLQMQRAADAAAVGAEIEWERDTGNWLAQGQADAAVNGFTNGSNGVTIGISQGATLGDYLGRSDVLQVTITQPVQTLFMGTLHGGTVTVTARAGALMPPCGYYNMAAGFSNIYGLWVASAGAYAACPVYANKSMFIDQFSTFQDYATNVAGGAAASANSGSVTPAPWFNAMTVPDPLAGIASPSFSSCTLTSYSLSSGTATLNPGTYCGTSNTKGMTITNATVTLNPGLYIITGGALWTSSTINGTGVTLFFTKGNGGGYGKFQFTNQTYVNLSAPTASSNGAIVNLLIFGDRAWVATTVDDFKCNNSYFAGNGIWYTTGSGVSIQNCGYFYAPNYLAMVTDNTYIYASTVNLKSDFSNIATGNPFRTQSVLVQ